MDQDWPEHTVNQAIEEEVIPAVKESLRDMVAGRSRPIREVLAELAAKHKLPPVHDD